MKECGAIVLEIALRYIVIWDDFESPSASQKGRRFADAFGV